MLYEQKHVFPGFNLDAEKCMPVSFPFSIVVQSDQGVFNTAVQQSVIAKSIVCTALFTSSLPHAEAGSGRSQRWMWSPYAVWQRNRQRYWLSLISFMKLKIKLFSDALFF